MSLQSLMLGMVIGKCLIGDDKKQSKHTEETPVEKEPTQEEPPMEEQKPVTPHDDTSYDETWTNPFAQHCIRYLGRIHKLGRHLYNEGKHNRLEGFKERIISIHEELIKKTIEDVECIVEDMINVTLYAYNGESDIPLLDDSHVYAFTGDLLHVDSECLYKCGRKIRFHTNASSVLRFSNWTYQKLKWLDKVPVMKNCVFYLYCKLLSELRFDIAAKLIRELLGTDTHITFNEPSRETELEKFYLITGCFTSVINSIIREFDQGRSDAKWNQFELQYNETMNRLSENHPDEFDLDAVEQKLKAANAKEVPEESKPVKEEVYSYKVTSHTKITDLLNWETKPNINSIHQIYARQVASVLESLSILEMHEEKEAFIQSVKSATDSKNESSLITAIASARIDIDTRTYKLMRQVKEKIL